MRVADTQREVFVVVTSMRLDEVQLTDDAFAPRRELVRRYLATFDVDRLMHTFRCRAGLSSSARPLGGWEAEDCGLRGHFVGHFLSACSRFAYADGDETLRTRACEVIDAMAACARPDGYLSAFEESALDVLEAEEDRNVWAPYYTLHKILQGLADGHVYVGHPQALPLAVGLARYIHRRFAKLSAWKIDGILRCTKVNPANEFGGIGDALYTLYELSGEVELLELAQLFDRDYFLGPLADGRDVLEDLHANTHLPLVLAAMHRHRLGGEQRYKDAALHFYTYLQGRTFANGNSSSKATACIAGGVSEKSEHWGGYGQLGDALTGGESESCCAHNAERIVERLLVWSVDTAYLDHLESLKYNAVLNSASARTGLSQYHQPLGQGVVKKFSEPYDSFWCCTGSGVEAMSELHKNIWFRHGDALLLNAFIASKAVWEEKRVRIALTTAYPNDLTASLAIEAAEPVELALMFKASAVERLWVNGEPVAAREAGGLVIVERVFRSGDTIDVEIAARLSLAPLPGDEGMAAVKYGQVLLALVEGEPGLTGIAEHQLAERFVRLPTERLSFAVTDELGRQAQFVPLYQVEDETYTVYVDWTGRAASPGEFVHAKDGSAAYD